MSAKTKAKAAASEARCYIGPSALGVGNGTIFSEGLPPMLEKAIADQPVIGSLVVPISGLAAANKALETPGSSLARFYSVAKEYFNTKKEVK